MKPQTQKESGEFHTRFCPYANRIYRSALILTGCPKRAERLQVELYLQAFIAYLRAGNIRDFERWLAGVALEILSKSNFRRHERQLISNAFSETERVIVEKLAECKKKSTLQLA